MAQENTKEEEFKNFTIGVNIGHSHMPTASVLEDPILLIIPTYGFDFEYWFNPKIATYTVKEEEQSKGIERDNPLIVALTGLNSPWENGLGFIIGSGFELEAEKKFFVLRADIVYEFELKNKWDFSPELIYDLKNGHINSLTLALGVGKRF